MRRERLWPQGVKGGKVQGFHRDALMHPPFFTLPTFQPFYRPARGMRRERFGVPLSCKTNPIITGSRWETKPNEANFRLAGSGGLRRKRVCETKPIETGERRETGGNRHGRNTQFETRAAGHERRIMSNKANLLRFGAGNADLAARTKPIWCRIGRPLSPLRRQGSRKHSKRPGFPPARE